MSYNYKTCSYCHGNHAILDCPRLVENAKQATEILANWDEAEYQKRRNVAELYNYAYKREWDDNDNIVYTKDDWDIISSGYYFERYKAEHGWTREQFDALPETVSPEEYGEQNDVRCNSKRRYERILEIHSEVQAKREARATKSCSYCKGKGHTVRTCPEKKRDSQAYKEAFQIYAYYTARAVARFGVWTGSMAFIHGAENKPFVFPPNSVRGFRSLMVDGIGSSTQEDYNKAVIDYQESQYATPKDGVPENIEDYRDFVYLSEFLGTHRFVDMTCIDSQSYIPWNKSGHLRTDWQSIDFDNNKFNDTRLLAVRPPDLLKRVYNAIMATYRPVAIPKRKGELSESQFCFRTCASKRWTSRLELAVTHYGSGSEQLFVDKKERKEQSWDLIRDYVEKNQHILNKIEELTV